ncbi:uncharacterized protein LOC129189080 [Dunckerocampus dactyliophorus]|uniref:uncharacterized protein LOC129189080 n=1 Tax=Dunckerocampus dactyliophorus TaxID=161453 RepID=UPI002406CF0B|nr:uncharacterized protein LOC129189080 [Dunckerocampus dactyliophorus]
MASEYQSVSSAESCKRLYVELSECFICRDVQVQAGDPLRTFCDCKNLLAHHVCISTWIQRGGGSEDRLHCVVCKAKYQLRRRPPWRSLSFQWQTWLAVLLVCVLLGLVPYAVHCMMTAFSDPPPPATFRVAAASFGVLAEVLLIKRMHLDVHTDQKGRTEDRTSNHRVGKQPLYLLGYVTLQNNSRMVQPWKKEHPPVGGDK